MPKLTVPLLLAAAILKIVAQVHHWGHENQKPLSYDDIVYPKYNHGTEDDFQRRVLPNTTVGQVKTFISDSSMRLGMEDDSEWNAFIPENRLIYLDNEGGQVFMPTMIHEIQCINVIRERIVSLGRQLELEVKNVESHQMAKHCVNYLRQMTLCHGDLAVEIIFGRPANAYGNLRLCRDWDAIYRGMTIDSTN